MEEVRQWARKNPEVLVLSPLVQSSHVVSDDLLDKVEKSGYEWVRLDGRILKINDLANFEFADKTLYNVELVVGKITDFRNRIWPRWLMSPWI